MIGRTRTVVWLAACGLAACSSNTVTLDKDDNFKELVAGGYRVAVMPFSVSAPEEGFLVDGLAALGNLVALEGVGQAATPREQAGAAMRRAFAASLAGAGWQTLELWATDTDLAHHGLSLDDMRDCSHGAEVAQILRVDGIVYGDLREWNRAYYLAQSTQSVALTIAMFDRRSGAVIYQATRREQSGSGLTGGPTGLISLGTEPLAGLRNSTLDALARSVSRQAAADLSGAGDPGAGDPRGTVPQITFASASLADGGNPGDKVLTVVAVGTAECDVKFDLGRYLQGIPMQQSNTAEDARGRRASYVGRYLVQAGEHVPAVPLFVSIRRIGVRGAAQAARRVPSPWTQADAAAKEIP